MNRLSALLYAGMLCLALQAGGEEVAMKPQYERLLKGEDAKQAALLEKRTVELEAADDYAGAVSIWEKLLALRNTVQGKDHWESVDAKWGLVAGQKIASLPAEQRAQWRQASQAYAEADQLKAKGQLVNAERLYQKALDAHKELLGERHPDTATSYASLALVLDAQGKSTLAQPLHEQAFELRKKLLGEHHPSTAASYSNVASNLEAQGKSAQAEPLHQKALELHRELLGEKHPHVVGIYGNLGRNLEAQRRNSEAQKLYQKSLDLGVELFGEKHPFVAGAYNDLAINLAEQSKFAEAQRLFQKSLDLHRELFGERHPDTAFSYDNLARTLLSQSKFAEAQPLFEKALDLRQELLGEKHPATLSSYNHLAICMSSQGKYAAALAIQQKVLNLRQEIFGDRHPSTAMSYQNLAITLKSLGRHAEAEPLLREALGIDRAMLGEEHPQTIAVYTSLAGNLHEQGRFGEASPMFQKSNDRLRRVLGEKHPQTARSYSSLALNLNALGKFSEAQPLHEKALDIRREVLGEKHSETAQSYYALADNLNDQKKYAAAQEYFQNALDLRLDLLGKHHPDTAVSYEGLGRSLWTQWKYAEAQQAYESALAIRQKVLGEKHPDTANSYNNLAGSLSAQGKYAESRPLREKAIAVYRELLGEQHPHTANSYTGLGFTLHAQAMDVEAQVALERAIHSYESSRLAGASGMDRATLVAFNPSLLLAALRAKDDPEGAWSLVEKTLARGLLDQQANKKVLSVAELTEQAQLQQEIAGLQSEAAVLAAKTDLTAEEAQHLNSLKDNRRRAEERLAALAVRASQREVAPNSAIREAIPANAALIFWIDVFDSEGGQVQEHWGCVVRRSGEPKWERLPGTGPGNQWTPADMRLHGKLRAVLAENKTTAEIAAISTQLSEQRLTPLRKHLHGVKSLFVVPVNAMTEIPCEVLTNEYTISYVPSGTFLARLKERAKPSSGKLLAVVDPDFAGRDWVDLPATRVEGTRIGHLYGERTLLLADSGASEQGLESIRAAGHLDEYRYLHFATHGEGNQVRAFESALILAQDSLPPDPLPQLGKPLLDGQLTAREVLDLWKLDADLVTLSACETAVGQSGGGDGALGFAQAFLTAGSRSVCLSLWKVDDTATTLLMERFYQNLLGRRPGLDRPMGKAAALAEAKNWLRKLSSEEALKLTADMTKDVVRGKGQKSLPVVAVPKPEDPAGAKDFKPFDHPKYWAAFILIGDPD